MQGIDIERVMAVLNNLKDEASTQILNLSRLSDYRMETINHSHNVVVESSDGEHSHGSGAHHHNFTLTGHSPTGGQGLTSHVSDQLTYPDEYEDDVNPDHKHIEPSIVYEREHIELSITYVSSIVSMGVVLGDDAGKMQQIADNMYTDTETFNNSYGSPWKEIDMLKQKIDDLETYANEHSTLQWIGEKFALINLMQLIVSYAIDAKWAITNYQDYMQRGYDSQFNGNTQSIAWEDKEKGATTGNRDQLTPGSVNIQRKTEDPY